MFYDVLCLRSILGFLLSERTSRVSPAIFSLNLVISLTYQNILPDVDDRVQEDNDRGSHYHLSVLQLTQQANKKVRPKKSSPAAG